MFTVLEVAQRLGVPKSSIYQLVEAGRLRCYRIGIGRGVIRISEEQLADFLAGRETGERKVVSRPPQTRLRHLS